MNAATSVKSAAANKSEGIILTTLQALPNFVGSALVLKLFDCRIIGGPVIFVLFASALLGVVTAWLGPKNPNLCKNYEPLFFDATLSVEQKLQRWLAKPGTAKQLLQILFMVALLAIAVLTVR